jgi:transcription antitermination factor NusG
MERTMSGVIGAQTSSETSWCILRMAGQRTLAVAESLAEAGIEVWTPVETKRHQLRAGKSGSVTTTQPIMPTFVFARSRHQVELAAIARAPISPHPRFSLFHHMDRIVTVKDREMERLRDAERRAVPKPQRPTLPVGTKVRPEQGPYTGLAGEVVSSKNGFCLVFFGGWMTVEIETFQLTPLGVDDAKPPIGNPA